MKTKISFSLLILCLMTLAACEEHYTPRPRGYFRIDLPAKEYVAYDTPCPLKTEIPTYSKVEVLNEGVDSCWFNLVVPKHKARIYFTYLSVEDNVHMLLDDAYKFAFKHEMKADAILRTNFRVDSSRVFGMIYDLEGNVASPLQFFATDSVNHFIRGSLYFEHAPNADSLKPVVSYLREDVVHLLENIEWK